MADKSVEATILKVDGPETKGWYAWNDVMPPPPDFVHVIGEVLVPNPGVEPELTFREPQGINPSVLLLNLHLRQHAGIWPQVLVWRPVRFDAILTSVQYSRTMIFFNDVPFVAMDVDTVHLEASITSLAGQLGGAESGGFFGKMSKGAARQNATRAIVGESPFPWFLASAMHPLCLTGSLKTVAFDVCMDGVPYRLNVQSDRSVRVRGANELVARKLEEFADKRLLITVCGHFDLSIENGCEYLSAESAEPAASFAARLRA